MKINTALILWVVGVLAVLLLFFYLVYLKNPNRNVNSVNKLNFISDVDESILYPNFFPYIKSKYAYVKIFFTVSTDNRLIHSSNNAKTILDFVRSLNSR